MLQIAIPIEQGNSGGPVLDMQGRVVGIVTMKSLVTANLGFAVPVNALKPLLEKPNPVPMERWLTIGVLDKSEWKTRLRRPLAAARRPHHRRRRRHGLRRPHAVPVAARRRPRRPTRSPSPSSSTTKPAPPA